MLYLIRHGETEFSRERKFQGCHEDLPLTSHGRDQAERVGIALSTCAFPVFSSPMKRAFETASAISRKVEVIACLRDVDIGPLGGKTPDEVSQLYPEFYQLWVEGSCYTLPGGEPPRGILGRVHTVLQVLPNDAIVVSHEGVIRYLICALLNLPRVNFALFKIDEASISAVERGQLQRLNDICHLRPY